MVSSKEKPRHLGRGKQQGKAETSGQGVGVVVRSDNITRIWYVARGEPGRAGA